MALLSTKINDLCLEDRDSNEKDSIMCSIPIAQRLVPEDEMKAEMREEYLLYDVVLLCGAQRQRILVSRSALASKLPQLIDMITMNENQATIFLPDIEEHAAKILVDFVYSRKVELKPSDIWDVFSVAEKLGINEIVNTCREYIQKNILTDSWLYTRQIALERGNEWLLTTVNDYICDQFSTLLQSTDFLQLPRLQVEIISKNEAIQSECDDILRLVVEWCKMKLEEEDLLEGLMEHNHLVYLASDNVLKDCRNTDFEDEPDAITDAQKEYIRQQTNEKQTSPGRSPRRPRSLGYKWTKDHCGRRALQFKKSFTSTHFKNEFELLAGTAMSERCYVGIAIIASEVVCISAYYNELMASCSSSVSSDSSGTDDMGLSLIKPMIRGRCSVGVAEVSNKVYAVGGYDRGHCLNLVECYDQERNEWVPTTSLKSARGRLGLCCCNGKLYAIGGSSGNCELKSVECFDPETKVWTQVCDMSVCRSNFDVCVLEGKIYAVGGTDGRHALKTVEVFDPEHNSWSYIASMEVPREGVCVSYLNGCVYACGGYEIWHCVASVECYHPHENYWCQVAPLNTARRGAGAAVLNNKLFVIGGTDGSHILKTVECYDPDTNTWSYVASMNSCRHNVGVTVSNGCIFVVGGFDGVAFLNTSEFYNAELDKWCAYTQV